MRPSRPDIFISATSADLGTCRQVIKQALLTLGCTPVEQTNFPPSAGSVRQMLREKLAQCDAVVHVVGVAYGSEPQEFSDDEPRRSYTQIEYETARELGKPVYLFICGDGFPYDAHEPEDDERRALQQAHRQRLQSGDELFTPVDSRDDLSLKVHQLQTRVERLADDLRRSRSRLARGVAVVLVVLAMLGVGLWWVNHKRQGTHQQVEQAEQRLDTVETELDKQRRYIKQVADVYSRQQVELAALRLTGQQRFDRAVAQVAQDAGVPPSEMRAAIDLFVAAVLADPGADFYDRALAEFAQQRFADAAKSAGDAADKARQEREAVEAVAKAAAERIEAARVKEARALALKAHAQMASEQFGQAVATYQRAIGVTLRQTWPETWAELHFLLGNAASNWAQRSTGAEIRQRRDLALSAYRSALEVFTADAHPRHHWTVRGNVALTQINHANAMTSADREPVLIEALETQRGLLATVSREKHPNYWAWVQFCIASTLADLAECKQGEQKRKLLEASMSTHRTALEIHRRETDPRSWAMSQHNLGVTLASLARETVGPKHVALLNEARTAFNAALEVYAPDTTPNEWAYALTQRASVLGGLARASSGDERLVLNRQAVRDYRSALEKIDREKLPNEWAMAQHNLGYALQDQAEAAGVKAGAGLREEAVKCFRDSLTINKRDSHPARWLSTQISLAVALVELAETDPAAQRAERLREAVQCSRDVLAVITEQSAPESWGMAQFNLGIALRAQAKSLSGEERLRGLLACEAAYRAALRVRPREVVPRVWAKTQHNIAHVMTERAVLTNDAAQRTAILEEAIQVYKDVAVVRAEHDSRVNWAKTLVSASHAFRHLAALKDRSVRFRFLDESLKLLEVASAVLTRERFPTEWANLQVSRAVTLNGRAFDVGGVAAVLFLEDSVAASEAALRVVTADRSPVVWRDGHHALGSALAMQALLVPATRAELLDRYRRAKAALETSIRLEPDPGQRARTMKSVKGIEAEIARIEGL